MTKKIIKLKDETDWAFDFGVFAINRDTRMFENTSWTKGMEVEIYNPEEEDFDENLVADALAEVFDDERGDYEYTLYDGMHQLVGFAYRPA